MEFNGQFTKATLMNTNLVKITYLSNI